MSLQVVIGNATVRVFDRELEQAGISVSDHQLFPTKNAELLHDFLTYASADEVASGTGNGHLDFGDVKIFKG